MKNIFHPLSMEAKYQKIIELGQQLPPFDAAHRLPANLVAGCQSTMYVHAWMDHEKLFFSADADALISKGLAALLIGVYSGESPEAILECRPTFIEEMGLKNALSLSRSNGLAHLYLKFQQEALRALMI